MPTTIYRQHFLQSLTLIVLLLIFALAGCKSSNEKKFRVYGVAKHPFSLHNQDNQVVTEAILKDKVYVTDFFFTTCPTICPLMKRQMVRIYEAYDNNPDLVLVSHTVDPETDTVEVLHNFAEGLGIETKRWQLLTGPQEEIFAIAKNNYMLGALKDENSPGGYIHSGSFVLVNKDKKILGYYDGTDAKEVDKLITDLRGLLDEK